MLDLGELQVEGFFGVHEGGRGRFFQTHGRVDSIFLSPPCAYCSETLICSSGGSSREGLDLGGSFGRFLMARRFGRKLQTPFIGFGKGQGQPLSSRLRVLFKKPSPRYRVACAADTDSDVHCGSDVHLLRFVPAHCTGEHFAILGRHGVFGR